MKTLMKKVGGCKKARFWNMAKFQTRRWHREQAEAAAATNIEPKTATLAPATREQTSAAMATPSPGGEGQGEGGLSSSNPTIQGSAPCNPLIPPQASAPPASSPPLIH